MIDDVVHAFTELRKPSLENKGRAVDRPNSAPEDVVFGIGDNKKCWESALKEARIKNLRWHDLRETFCSRLAQAGVSLKVIQEAAGHKTISMSARDAHMDQTTLINAMAILNRNKRGEGSSNRRCDGRSVPIKANALSNVELRVFEHYCPVFCGNRRRLPPCLQLCSALNCLKRDHGRRTNYEDLGAQDQKRRVTRKGPESVTQSIGHK
jgi:hypothetical protein